MATLIKPQITISKPIKNKSMGYSITLDPKTKARLIVRARTSDGRSRGIVAYIQKDGTIEYLKQMDLWKLFNTSVVQKVDLTLDLIFGSSRKEKCETAKNGLIQVKRN